jgi:hypothetical protein
MNKTKITCLFALLLPALHSYGDAGEMYRYIDDQGKVAIGYHVPVEDVKRGYEVLNEDGMVIEVVPRELTEEERNDRDAQERLEAEATAEIERLRAWDESLLLKYSTVEDIEASRKRALSSLLINVSILKSNTRSLKQQVENYQAQAADIERRGGTVDVERLVAIEDLQSEIEATERSIAERNKETEVVEAEYQLDIQRFEQLLDIVALRRTMMVPD